METAQRFIEATEGVDNEHPGQVDISSAVTLSTPKKATQSIPAATGLGTWKPPAGRRTSSTQPAARR